MNVQQGLDSVLCTPYSMRKLSLCIDSDNSSVRNTVLTLLAAVCLCFDTDGHKQVLEATTHFKLVKREDVRFQTLVDQLKDSDDALYQVREKYYYQRFEDHWLCLLGGRAIWISSFLFRPQL